MRTLKKTLCLVLCLAMMAGLFAISANAVFTDAEEIQNKEAVDLLVGLGIIEGYTDGSFNPTKVLNRAEAAKIVAYLLLGKDGADTLPKANTQFEDVTAAHWASGYVGYCASQGIINGKSATKFAPSDTLKAAEWAKMLLCALGYKADIEGMTGSNWDFNVTRLVTRVNLYSGFNGSAEMTRDEACLMAFNALTVPKVEYKNGVTVTTGDGTKVDVNAEKEYRGYLADNYGLEVDPYVGAYEDQKDDFELSATKTGVILLNSYNRIEDTDKTRLSNYTKDFAIETGKELLGHYVKIYVNKAGKALSVSDIGTTIEVAKKIKADNKAGFKSAFGVSKVELSEDWQFINGMLDTNATALEAGVTAVEPGTYVLNDQGKLVCEIFDSYKYKCLDTVKKIDKTADKEAIELTFWGKFENNEAKDEIEEYAGIAKDDIVAVTMIGARTILAKPETVEGKIGKFDAKTGAITVDGTSYDLSDAIDFVASAVDPSTLTPAQMKGNTYVVYLVDGEYVHVELAKEEVAPFEPYYLLTETVTKKTTLENDALVDKYYTQVLDKDGAISTVQVENAAAISGLGKKFVTIKAVKDKEYKALAAITTAEWTDAELALSAYANLKTASNTDKYGSIRVNADTKFYFISEKSGKFSVEIKSGLFNMKDARDAQIITSTDKYGNVIAKTVYVDGAFTEETKVDMTTIVYATGAGYSSANADGYVYTVYDMTGAAKEITMEAATTPAQGFYSFTVKDGITSLTAYSTNVLIDQVVTGQYSGKVQLGSTEIDVSSAAFVDLRDGGDVTDLDSLVKAAADVKIDIILEGAGKPAAAIFVKAA